MIKRDPVDILLVARQERSQEFETAISGLGETLVRAYSEGEALKTATGREFAAILLDAGTVPRSGLGLAQLIRKQSGLTPILFLGVGDDFPVGEAYGLGEVDHLAAPVDPDVLRAKLGMLAERLRRTRGTATGVRTSGGSDAPDPNQLWRTTLASIGDAVIATDVDGRVAFLNPVAEKLTGWPLAEARGTPLTEVFHIVNEATRKPVENPALRALRSGTIVGLANHTVLIARDGAERPIDDSAAPIRDASGAVSGAVLVFRDISERKRSEIAQARLAAIVESSHDAIVGKDLDGTILTWNGGAERVFGYTAEEAVGKSITIVVPPDRINEEREILGRIRRGERIEHFETRRLRKDGRLVDVALTISPIRDAHGRIVGASKIARDVTAAKRAERVQASALQAGEVGTYYWDVKSDRVTGDRNFVNILGVLPDDGASAPVADFLAAIYLDDRDRVATGIRRTLETDVPFRNEYRVAGPAGERWLLARGAVERGAEGEPVGWVGVVVDITDRKRAEEALVRSRARLDYAVRASGIGFWYCDLPFDVLEWDRRVKEHFWLPPDARVTIDTFYERIHPDDRGPTRTAIERSIAEKTGYDVHYRTVDPASMAEKWIRAIGGADYDEAGHPMRFDGVTLDVSAQRRTEAELRESNDRFAIVARATNDAVWDWDMRTDEVWWNEGVTALFGHPPEDVGHDASWWYDHILPDDRQRVVDGIHEVLDHGREKWSEEYRFRKADGSYASVLDRGYAIQEAGKTVRLVGAMQDVTENRRTEERLRESERHYRTLFESIDEGFCVVEVLFDESGRAADYRFLKVNPVFERQTGLQDVVGKRMRDLVPDHDDHWFDIYGRVATTGEPVRFQEYAHALGRFFDVYAFPAGVPEAHNVAVLFRDVTTRKRAEESMQFLADASASLAELVDYQSTLRRIANLAVGGFADWCVVDLVGEDGRRERLAVTAAESEVVSAARRADAAFSPDDAAGLIPHVLRTGQPEVAFDLEKLEPTTAAQGAERLAALRSLGVRSYLCVPLISRGRVIGGMTFLSSSARRRFGPEELRVARNLTERVTVAIENAQLYRTLQDQDRRKDEFLATLAHELRNPLAPIRNGLQILRMAGKDGETVDLTLAMMERQLRHVTHLVDDLMDVARVSSGKVALRMERAPLRAILDAAVETSREGIEAAGHELALRTPTDGLTIEGDRTRLVQVLANLLNNAAKYTPQGGRITLSVQRDGGYVAIRVADTGVGIPSEMLPRVFEMFTQVGTSLERSQGGLGIGLTLVKRLVEMHGGTVGAESPGPGEGSTFTVRLPLAAEASRMEDVGTDSSAATPGELPDILVVDDNKDSAESLAMLLRIRGHVVKVAHDGPEALRILASFRPQLILLDLGLPGMSGYEVAIRIRESAELRGVTLAALTGWGQEEDRRRTRKAGFDFHLVKPADPQEIHRIISGIQPRA